MWRVRKEYIGMVACLPEGHVIILKEKMTKKEIEILRKYNYIGLEKVEKTTKTNES